MPRLTNSLKSFSRTLYRDTTLRSVTRWTSGFVSGHDFSRAVSFANRAGFSPRGFVSGHDTSLFGTTRFFASYQGMTSQLAEACMVLKGHRFIRAGRIAPQTRLQPLREDLVPRARLFVRVMMPAVNSTSCGVAFVSGHDFSRATSG